MQIEENVGFLMEYFSITYENRDLLLYLNDNFASFFYNTQPMTHMNFDGQQRIAIENVTPQIQEGRYAIKRVEGDVVRVEADILIDGHDLISARLLLFSQDGNLVEESPMHPFQNDRWWAKVSLPKLGGYYFQIMGWVDHISTWQHEVDAKVKDGQHLKVELRQGIEFLLEMRDKAKNNSIIEKGLTLLQSDETYSEAISFILSDDMTSLIRQYPQKQFATYSPQFPIWVDRKKANFSAWYSLFPRSTSRELGKHGTFQDVEALLPRIQRMGFDVLYIPPISPIGHTHRKGKNNSTVCQPGEPGVPYGIGSELGGHTAIHPDLGTLDDLKSLIKACHAHDMELALDLAIQCSPDHPWVKEHPEWFKILPDGSIRYAENPPKKYQDIYPINFETSDWQNLWTALKDIIFTWASWGIRIIRVDNPHTKSFVFWEWVIAETRKVYPDMIFLSEAFTKPKIMQQLAKVGFTQSYTYYVWRTTKAELVEYMEELTQSDMKEYFRPNFWPNTHDINPYMLQSGDENQFLIRYFMAATLVGNYGIFGPSYEYMYHAANAPKEEYLNSEKYEIKWWDWEHENKLTYLITQVNQIRRENTAFHATLNWHLCVTSNEQLFAYLKVAEDGNRILCVVNLSGSYRQQGLIRMPLSKLGKQSWDRYKVHDLLTGSIYEWQGEENFVDLDPYILPFHLFRIED